MSQRFTTEFVAEQPVVAVLGDSSPLLDEVVGLLETGGLRVLLVKPEDILGGFIPQQAAAAHKMIWVVSGRVGNTGYEAVKNYLKSVSIPVTLVMPLISPISASTNTHEVVQQWYKRARIEQEVVLDSSHHLPRCNFVFLIDLTESPLPESSPLFFAAKLIEQGILVDPKTTWYLQDTNSALKAAKEYLIRTQSSGSVLIRADGSPSTGVLDFIKEKYGHYHQFNLKISPYPQVQSPPVPFVVSEKISTGISWEKLSVIAQNLPRPKVSEFSAASSPLEEELEKPDKNQGNQKKQLKSIFSAKLPTRESLSSAAPLLAIEPDAKVSSDVGSGVVPEKTTDNQVENSVANSPTPQKTQEAPASKTTAFSSKQPDFPPKKTQEASVKNHSKSLDVNEELSKIFTATRTEQKVEHIKKLVKTEKKFFKKSKRKTTMFWAGLVSIFAAASIVVLAGVFVLSQYGVKKALVGVIVNAQTTSVSEIEGDQHWETLRKRNSFLEFQTNAYTSLIDSAMFSQASLLVELSSQMREAVVSVDAARSSTEKLVLAVLGREDGDVSVLAQNLNTEAQRAYENLSLLQAGLDQVDSVLDLGEEESLVNQYSGEIKKLRDGLVSVQQLETVLDDLVGIGGRRTYALVLQNNQELRPTGGFIQAVAILSFENGSLSSHQIYSSYEIDRRFGGAISPPEEIRQFLGEQNWYFRDSNWDPSFPVAAERMAWFMDKSLGIKLDGVIGLNLYALEEIIAALGPVDLEEYNETLTNKNLQERMEFHSEVVLVETSESKDYSAVVLSKIFEKVKNVQEDKITSLLGAFSKSISTQQMAIAAFNADPQLTLTSLGWTGELIKPNCPALFSNGTCVVDSTAQVEANVGVNKANYYIKRSIDQMITINPDRINHQRTVLLENTAQTNSWPKGSYKTYIRFYIPQDSVFSEIKIDDQVVGQDQLTLAVENEKMIIGVLVDVPIQTSRQVRVSYTTPFEADSTFSYAFFNQKQAGTNETPSTITIINNSKHSPVLIAPQAEVVGNTIVFDKINEKHSFVGVRFE